MDAIEWPRAGQLGELKKRLTEGDYEKVTKVLEEPDYLSFNHIAAKVERFDVEVDLLQEDDDDDEDEDCEEEEDWELEDADDAGDEKDNDEGKLKACDPLLLKLLETHPAKTVVLLVGRASPNSRKGGARRSFRSQVGKLLDACDEWDKKEPGKIVMFNRIVGGEDIDANRTHLAPYNAIHRRILHYASILRDLGKDVVVMATEPIRFHRDAEQLVKQKGEIEGLGEAPGRVRCRFLNNWDQGDGDGKGGDVYAEALKTLKAKRKRIEEEFGSHRDAAKHMRRELHKKKPDIAETQSKINIGASLIEKNLGEAGTAERKWLDGAVLKGNKRNLTEVDAKCMELIEGAREHPDEAKELAQQYFDLVKARGVKFGKGDGILALARSSPNSAATYIDDVKGSKVPAHQVASIRSFLDHSELSDEAKNATTLLVLTETKRQQKKRNEFGIIAWDVAHKIVGRFMLTTTTRLSQHKGIVIFIRELCRLAGVEFTMTECIGLEANDVAEQEHLRAEGLKAATQQFNDSILPDVERMSDLGKVMYSIATSKLYGGIMGQEGDEESSEDGEEKKPKAKKAKKTE